MDASRTWDKERLMEMSKNDLLELLLVHIRNIWSEDGLYFLGIENKFGKATAVDIDQEVWSAMGKIEARRLKKTLGIQGGGIPELMQALKHTSWWLDLEHKEFEEEKSRAVLRNKECYMQLTRKKKGLGEFDCKQVRHGFLGNFIKEFNPDIQVKCNFCPPDKHPDDTWCEWEFVLE